MDCRVAKHWAATKRGHISEGRKMVSSILEHAEQLENPPIFGKK